MYVELPSRIRNYYDKKEPVYESPNDQYFDTSMKPNWIKPEDLLTVENIDYIEFIAFRVELKK